MTVNEIISIISSVGFPIVACVGLGIYVKKQTELYREDVKDIQREHKEEISKVTEALNNNTLALQKLVDRLDDRVDN